MIPNASMVPAFVVHVCLGLIVALGLVAKWGAPGSWKRAFGLLAVATGISMALGLLTAPDPGGFSKLLVWSWSLAIVFPATAIALAIRNTPHRALQGSFASMGLISIVLSAYAFAWEPQNLEVTHHRIASDRVQAPLRIAVIADLQTDAPGDHERAALQAVVDAKPDLIVFVGDVIQHQDEDAYAKAWAALRGVLAPLALDAPLGVYLVEGDSEHPHGDAWIREAEASGLQVWPRETTTRSVRPDVALTGFGLRPSANPGLQVERTGQGLHVVFGHRPAFALGQIDADLLLAGHTHGGQVQLPGFGPLLTLSKVPRSWASGRTELPSGATLLVSRGVGMERAGAPRIRFWCRPEVMIVDVVPTGG
ncbi:MAG: metallophosphoesterase [Nannocystales bacterium]